MAFAATTDKAIVESASDSEDSSNDEVPKKLTLQEAYDKLCIEFIKSKKTSHYCRKELCKVEFIQSCVGFYSVPNCLYFRN